MNLHLKNVLLKCQIFGVVWFDNLGCLKWGYFMLAAYAMVKYFRFFEMGLISACMYGLNSACRVLFNILGCFIWVNFCLQVWVKLCLHGLAKYFWLF